MLDIGKTVVVPLITYVYIPAKSHFLTHFKT